MNERLIEMITALNPSFKNPEIQQDLRQSSQDSLMLMLERSVKQVVKERKSNKRVESFLKKELDRVRQTDLFNL